MKLYDGGRAPNPRRVRIFLAEKGVSVPTVQVDIMAGEQRSEAIARLNPLMRVPILELDDGTAIAESVAICRYFEEVQPDPPLFGTDARDKAIVEMWNRRLDLNLGLWVSSAARHGLESMAALEPVQVKEWAEFCRPRIVEFLDWLDRDLVGRDFIAGPRFTIADITALCVVDFMKVVRIRLEERHGTLRRWHETVSARPSAAA
jgi:glutathione S-transferase